MPQYCFDKIYKTKDNIEIHYTQGLPTVYEHTHDYYEFCIVLGESIINRIDNQAIYTGVNEGVLIFPENRHAISAKNNGELNILNISFRRKLFDECWNFLFGNTEINIPQTPVKVSPRRLADYQALYIGFGLMDKATKTFQERKLVMELIFLLTRDTKNTMEKLPEWLEAVIAYFKNPTNYSNEEGLKAIYRISGYSKPQFNKLFKRYLNRSPIQYYNECKIENARLLLIESKLDIQYISNYLGFSSIAHFIHLFKSMTGTTPLQYRKKYFTENEF